MNVSQKFSSLVERVRSQGHQHKERQELEEMQRQEDLLLKIKKRQKALEKYEKAKRKASLALEERNLEK
jgi:hypothetical protein